MQQQKYTMKKTFLYAFSHTTPILTGFLFLGIAYGVLMRSIGYGLLPSFLMSAVAYCGSMQYAAVPLLLTACNPLQAFILSLTVNARHLFYGISFIEKYRGAGRIKPVLIYTLCDETYSIISGSEIPENVDSKWFYFFVSVLDYSYWVIATVMGSVLGQFIPTDIKGIDFVLTALFVVIFLNQWDNCENRLPALIGLAITILCRLLFGSAYFLIPAMLLIVAALFINKKRFQGNPKASESEEKEENTCI